MKELTKQQSKVLTFVEVYLNKTGFPPTRAEIQANKYREKKGLPPLKRK